MTVGDGDDQSTTVDTAFASSLSITVASVDAVEPVSGGVITFTAPPIGASATILGSPATIAHGGSASATATANDTPGGPYSIAADTGAGSGSFSLSNVALTPTADSQSLTLAQDTDSNEITLTGSDPASLPLAFTVTGEPSNGSLSGTAPNLTYTPDAGYSGPDSFTFNVTNGTATSDDATVSITVVATPSADGQSVTFAQDSSDNAITLTGSDPASLPLTYTVTGEPSNGSLSGTAPNLTYTPGPGYFGSDSFTFNVNNGTATSSDATVSISVIGTPTADDQSVSFGQDSGNNAFTLTGSDPASLPLTYEVTGGPTNGSLNGTAPNLTYRPDPGYFGPDSFTFNVSNGTSTSSDVTVTISVYGTPTADGQSVTFAQDSGGNTITLTGSDPSSLPLTYQVTGGPSNGSLSGSAPNLTYTPDSGYFGPDSFTFNVNNGISSSSDATVSISVVGTPTADSQLVTVAKDSGDNDITLTGTDPASLPLTFTVDNAPANGTLSGNAPNLTYTPNQGYYGSDSFTFNVSNGTSISSDATVSITVTGTPISDLYVTTLIGTGPGSLPYAINSANLDAGDTIHFQEGVTGTLFLSSSLPTITSPMTISGPGASLLAIDGGGTIRPIAIDTGGPTVTISGLTIQNGSDIIDSEGGAGISVASGDLSMSDCVIATNRAVSNGGAMLIFPGASAELDQCSLTGNIGGYGGETAGGGAIDNLDGSATLTACTLNSNSAYFGGAMFDVGTLSVTVITNCTLCANSSTVGGAIFTNAGSNSITNCTISANSSVGGGGIFATGGSTTFSNCIIFGDTAIGEINNVNGGTVTVSYCDIAGGVVSGVTDGGSNITGKPLLSALGSYGGPTQTIGTPAGFGCSWGRHIRGR